MLEEGPLWSVTRISVGLVLVALRVLRSPVPRTKQRTLLD